MEITTKQQFFELWRAGVLGNRTNVWDDPYEAFESGSDKFGFRELRKMRGGSGAWTRINRQFKESRSVFRMRFFNLCYEWRYLGRTFIIDDQCPIEQTTLQGELCLTTEGLTGFLAVDPKAKIPPMREAFAKMMNNQYSELQTRMLMKRYMDPSTITDIEAIFDLFPDAAIEFSTFRVNTGNLPGRNTIIWEVRNY